jgi:hypothetical protein
LPEGSVLIVHPDHLDFHLDLVSEERRDIVIVVPSGLRDDLILDDPRPVIPGYGVILAGEQIVKCNRIRHGWRLLNLMDS